MLANLTKIDKHWVRLNTWIPYVAGIEIENNNLDDGKWQGSIGAWTWLFLSDAVRDGVGS